MSALPIPLICSPKPTFCSTVIQGNSAYSWNTMPRSGPGPATGTPSVSTRPELGGAKPAIALSRVDLPQPDGPSRHTNWPCGIFKSMSFSATRRRPSLSNSLPTRSMTMWSPMSVLQAAVPAQQVIVEPVHAGVDRQPEDADGDHAGDDLVGPEVLARFQDAKAQAVVHRDHLGHDHHDEGGADADPHAGQAVGHGGRQDHAQEQRGAGGAQVARRAQVDAVDLAHAGDGVHQHREEGAERDQEERR